MVSRAKKLINFTIRTVKTFFNDVNHNFLLQKFLILPPFYDYPLPQLDNSLNGIDFEPIFENFYPPLTKIVRGRNCAS